MLLRTGVTSTPRKGPREAAKEVGPGFALQVTSLFINDSPGSKTVSAVVTAWNEKEIRDISVQWEEGN